MWFAQDDSKMKKATRSFDSRLAVWCGFGGTTIEFAGCTFVHSQV
jgi:hypothetical protein